MRRALKIHPVIAIDVEILPSAASNSFNTTCFISFIMVHLFVMLPRKCLNQERKILFIFDIE